MKQKSTIDCSAGLPAPRKHLNPLNRILSKFCYNENCYINTYAENWPRAVGNEEEGAHEFEAGGSLVPPDVAEPCLLVASVRAGLRAQRAVKLKAPAQSGLLPGVCIQPELLPHQERESLRGALVRVGQREPRGSQDLRLWHSLTKLWGGCSETSWLLVKWKV